MYMNKIKKEKSFEILQLGDNLCVVSALWSTIRLGRHKANNYMYLYLYIYLYIFFIMT